MLPSHTSTKQPNSHFSADQSRTNFCWYEPATGAFKYLKHSVLKDASASGFITAQTGFFCPNTINVQTAATFFCWLQIFRPPEPTFTLILGTVFVCDWRSEGFGACADAASCSSTQPTGDNWAVWRKQLDGPALGQSTVCCAENSGLFPSFLERKGSKASMPPAVFCLSCLWIAPHNNDWRPWSLPVTKNKDYLVILV